jgi:hypothetical protein
MSNSEVLTIDVDFEVGQFIHDEFLELAKPHIDRMGGRMVPLNYDPKKYPAQNGFYVRGYPLEPHQVSGIADKIEPKFSEVEGAFDSPANQAAIDAAEALITDNKNVILATNHARIQDIAFAKVAVQNRLKARDMKFKSGIMISKMVSAVGFHLDEFDNGSEVPSATTALQILCDEIFITYPQTKSVKNSPIARRAAHVIKRHNPRVKSKIADTLAKKGNLISVALSGSVDRYDGDSVFMQQITKGTVGILKTPDTYVLPMPIWIGKDIVYCEALSEPVKVTSEPEVHRIMHDMAHVLTKEVPDHNFEYLGPEHK